MLICSRNLATLYCAGMRNISRAAQEVPSERAEKLRNQTQIIMEFTTVQWSGTLRVQRHKQ